MDDRFDFIVDDDPFERGRVVEPGVDDVGIAAAEVGHVTGDDAMAALRSTPAEAPCRSDQPLL